MEDEKIQIIRDAEDGDFDTRYDKDTKILMLKECIQDLSKELDECITDNKIFQKKNKECIKEMFF